MRSLDLHFDTLDVLLLHPADNIFWAIEFHDSFDLLESEAHLDSMSSVAILARFDNPSVLFLKFIGLILITFIDFLISFMVVS